MVLRCARLRGLGLASALALVMSLSWAGVAYADLTLKRTGPGEFELTHDDPAGTTLTIRTPSGTTTTFTSTSVAITINDPESVCEHDGGDPMKVVCSEVAESIRMDLGQASDTVDCAGIQAPIELKKSGPISFIGGEGNDIVRVEGSAAGRFVDGGGGDDLIELGQSNSAQVIGGDGDDVIIAPQIGIDSQVQGGAGDDTIITSGAHNSGTYGDAGNDLIVSAGAAIAAQWATFWGGDGDDIINVADIPPSPNSSTERVNCGGGHDRVDRDPVDLVVPNTCEEDNARPSSWAGEVEVGGPAVVGPADLPSVSFPFVLSQPGVKKVECRVDTGAWEDCLSPFEPGSLAEGTHVVEVRATDWQNDVAVGTWLVNVDLTAPEVALGSVPATTTAESVDVELSADESPVTFECRVGDGGWQSCSSPYRFALALGENVLSVRATDEAGNVSEPATAVVRRDPLSIQGDRAPQVCERPLQVRRLSPVGKGRGRLVAWVPEVLRSMRLELREQGSGRVLASLVPDVSGSVDVRFRLPGKAGGGRVLVTADGRPVTSALRVDRRFSKVSVTRRGSTAYVRGSLPVKGRTRVVVQARGCDGGWSTRRTVTVRGGKLNISAKVRSGDTQLRVVLPIGARGWHSIPFGIAAKV